MAFFVGSRNVRLAYNLETKMKAFKPILMIALISLGALFVVNRFLPAVGNAVLNRPVA